jgi:transcriptional regulator with XRE-family HTH domain
MNSFTEWLDAEIKKRNMDISDVAKRGNISVSMVSLVRSGARKPGAKTCAAIAKALSLPEEEVLVAAGLMKKTPEITNLMKRVTSLMQELSPEQQERFYEFAKLWVKTTRKS